MRHIYIYDALKLYMHIYICIINKTLFITRLSDTLESILHELYWCSVSPYDCRRKIPVSSAYPIADIAYQVVIQCLSSDAQCISSGCSVPPHWLFRAFPVVVWRVSRPLERLSAPLTSGTTATFPHELTPTPSYVVFPAPWVQNHEIIFLELRTPIVTSTVTALPNSVVDSIRKDVFHLQTQIC